MEKKKIADLSDMELYIAVRKIADMIFEYVGPRHRIDMEDRRQQGCNPYYNQTSNGFFLEMYYSLPNKLWTPWGEYGFGGSGGGLWEKVLPEILERLGTNVDKPHKAVEQTKMGVFGPVYAIRRIDNVILPEPVELKESSYDSYKDTNKAWETLTKQHKRNKRKYN